MLPKKICLQSQSGGTWLGVENRNVSLIKCNFRDYCATDGSPLLINLFDVIQYGILPLFAFRAFNGQYWSPMKDGRNHKIGFSKNLTSNEYFQIVWHSKNIISLKLWTNKYIYVNSRDNKLYCDGDNWKAPECAFLIKPNPQMQLNNNIIPMPQLNAKIYLKSKELGKFLTYRSKPDHFEATALMTGQWETLVLSVKKLDNSGLIVNIITANGKYFSCNNDGTINFLVKDNGSHCWWEIFFVSKQDICIRSFRWRTWFHLNSKGWLFCDEKDNLKAIQTKSSIFECMPWANCGGPQQSRVANNGSMSNNNVAFSM